MIPHPASATWASDGRSDSGPKDWSSSYAQYLARSAEQSSGTLKLYQQTLEYIARGKLAPTVFQDHLSQFMQARAVEYATKLSELSARFLSGLVRIGVAVGNSAAPGQAGVREPDIEPPRFEAGDPGKWFQQLAEYAGQLNARALDAYRRQLDRVAAGDATPSESYQVASDYLSQQLPGYLQSAGQLYLDLMNGVNEMRSNYEKEYFLGILATAEGPDAEPPVVLKLSGPPGGTASASIAVTNTTPERTTILCTATDVRRADGQGPAFTPQIEVSPEGLELNPAEEGALQLALLLDEARYDADALYVGSLHVTGRGDLRVDVKLRITADTKGATGER